MSSKTKTEMLELKEFLNQRLNEIELKIAQNHQEIKDEMKENYHKVDKRLSIIESKLETAEDNNKTIISKFSDISEKFGELKN